MFFKDKIGIGLTQLSSSNTCALYLSVGLTGISTVTDFKAKLAELYEAGNPVEVYYVLSEPEYIECTEEQNTILDKIETELHSYEGGTHVYSTDAISPIFNAKYTKDLNAVINNLSQQAIEGGN